MKLHLVTAALLVLATAAPVAAGRNNLRRRHLNNLAAFEEDVVDIAHRRLHCDTSTEQACVKTCRKKNDCQEPSDPCTKSCRAKCCEKDNEDIDIPDRPERKCDREEEQACFSECKRDEGQFADGDCRDDGLSSSEQDMCIKKCRDNCCEFEESEESRDDDTPAPTPGLTESKSEPAPLITPGPTAGPTPGPTAGPTPGPTASPTEAPTASPTKAPTPPESKDTVTASPTAPPTTSPTAAPKCTTDMDAAITCNVKDKDSGNVIADCNDDDIYSKTNDCEVTMEYCFEAHHGDEDNADAAQCLTLEEAQANMNGVEIPDFLDMLCEDTKDMGDGTNDCKVCKSRANPAAYCVTVDANICECVESKSTMDFVATQDGAECPADGDLNVDICDDCEIDISITCVAKAPFSNTFNRPCSTDGGFSIVGENQCVEEIKLCYEIENTGNTCAYWRDLDVTASRTVTNGDMVSRKDVTVDGDNAMICPGEKVMQCEEPIMVNSCNCMTVVAEAQAKNPRDGTCSTEANYGFCKEEESRSEDMTTPGPTPGPTKAPTVPSVSEESKASEPKPTKAPTEPSVSEESKASEPAPTKAPTVSEESESKASMPKPTKAPTVPSVSEESKASEPKPTKAPTEPSVSEESKASAPAPEPSPPSVSEESKASVPATKPVPSPKTPPSVSVSEESKASAPAPEPSHPSLPSSGSSRSEDHSGSKPAPPPPSPSTESSKSAPAPPSPSTESSKSAPAPPSPSTESSKSAPPPPSPSTESSRSAPAPPSPSTPSSSETLPSGGSKSSSSSATAPPPSPSTSSSGTAPPPSPSTSSSGTAPSSSGDSDSSGASGGSGKGKGGSSSGKGKGSKSGKSSKSSSGKGSKSSKSSKGDSGGSDPSGSQSGTASDSNSRYYPGAQR